MLTANRKALLAAVQLCLPAVPAKDLRPVLMNLKLTHTLDGCTLTATDTELGIAVNVEGVAANYPGEMLIPAARLAKILKELTDDEVTISHTDQEITIGTPSRMTQFDLPTAPASEYPDFPTLDFQKDRYSVTAGTLRDLIQSTNYATASDSARYTMTGVLLAFAKESVECVGTDGRRLAHAENAATYVGQDEARSISGIVPARAADLVAKSLPDDDATPITVQLRVNDIVVVTPEVTIYSRLLDGRFPDYRSVLPKSHTTTVSVAPSTLTVAVRQAAVMTADAKRVTFSFQDATLTLTAQGSSTGKSSVKMLGIAKEGDNLTINVNPDYVLEFLKALKKDIANIQIELSKPDRPILFRAEKLTYLLMPLT